MFLYEIYKRFMPLIAYEVGSATLQITVILTYGTIADTNKDEGEKDQEMVDRAHSTHQELVPNSECTPASLEDKHDHPHAALSPLPVPLIIVRTVHTLQPLVRHGGQGQ